jgi:hypothetical protein
MGVTPVARHIERVVSIRPCRGHAFAELGAITSSGGRTPHHQPTNDIIRRESSKFPFSFISKSYDALTTSRNHYAA